MLGILSPALKLQFKSNKMPTSRIAGCVAACQRQLRGRSQLMTDAACGWAGQGGEGRCLRWGPKGVATKCHSTTRRHKHTGDSKSAEQFGGRRVSLIEPSDWAAPMPVHRASRWHVCLGELLLQTMLKCARISHAWITGERCFLYYTYIYIYINQQSALWFSPSRASIQFACQVTINLYIFAWNYFFNFAHTCGV